jgi:hypothetical protein
VAHEDRRGSKMALHSSVQVPVDTLQGHQDDQEVSSHGWRVVGLAREIIPQIKKSSHLHADPRVDQMVEIIRATLLPLMLVGVNPVLAVRPAHDGYFRVHQYRQNVEVGVLQKSN